MVQVTRLGLYGGPRPPQTFTAASASVAITGTAIGATEAEIRAGGKTIVITLTNDTWVAAGAAFDAERQAIIDGLDSAQSEETGWNAEVRDKEVVSAVARTSDTVVTITLSAAPDYKITADEEITVTVPASALVTSTADVVGATVIAIGDISGGGGLSMTEIEMRRLERQQLRRLAAVRRDDDEVAAILSSLLN